jgi:hypothetical protein
MINNKKLCSKCQQEKPISFFGKDSAQKSGLTCSCKDCRSLYNKTQRRELITPLKRKILREKSRAWYWKRRSPETLKKHCEQEKQRYKQNKKQIRKRIIARKYNVTVNWYNETLDKQRGICAICQKPETAKWGGNVKQLAVDHCHSTEKVRGLLCHACNTGIGSLNDDPLLLQRAIDYLNSNA